MKEQLLVVLEQVVILSGEGPQLLDAHQQEVVVRVIRLCLLQQPLQTQHPWKSSSFIDVHVSAELEMS